MIFDEIAFNSFSDTKNVFIGARFNSSQNKWFWSDGTVANFSSSGLETCQQKALHYGNGWEIINKNCTGDEARFACQIGCKLKCFATTKGHIWMINLLIALGSIEPFVDIPNCNGTTVIILWKQTVKNLTALTSNLKVLVWHVHFKFAPWNQCTYVWKIYYMHPG